MLRSLGYDTGPVDGVFGPRTQAAVQWFQVKRGDRPSGVLDPESLSRLRGVTRGRPLPSDSASLPEPAASPLPSAGWHGRPIRNPLGDGKADASAPADRARRVAPLRLGAGYRIPDGSQRVRRIQRMLRRLGYESGVVDGRFGPRTKASVQWFQIKHGFEPSGIVGAATLTRLRALARGEAPVQRVRSPGRERASAPGPRPRAHADTAHDSGVSPLLLAFLGALGATAILLLSITARRRRPRDPTTSAANGRQPRPGGKPSRDDVQPTPPPDPSPAVATASAHVAQASNGTTPARTPRRLGRPPSPPVIGYATGHDRDDLERQAAAIERACRERGWTLALVVRDHGSHECEALVRPGLAHALEQLRGGSAARLVVDRLERLGSSVADLRPLRQWCATNEVDLVALDSRTDASAQEAHVASGVGNGGSGNGHTDSAKAGAKRSNGSERTDGAWT